MAGALPVRHTTQGEPAPLLRVQQAALSPLLIANPCLVPPANTHSIPSFPPSLRSPSNAPIMLCFRSMNLSTLPPSLAFFSALPPTAFCWLGESGWA